LATFPTKWNWIAEMAVHKRGDVWWYKFTYNGELIRESTKRGNKRTAEQIEAGKKTQLAKAEVGIKERGPVQTYAEFVKKDFLPNVQSTFADKKTTLAYYRIQRGHLTAHTPLASSKLHEISVEMISGFVDKRRQAKYEISSINRALQVLLRSLHFALETGKVDKLPVKISLVPGEKRRERVLSPGEEEAFLSSAAAVGDSIVKEYEKALGGIRAVHRGEEPRKPGDPYLLRDVATVLLGCGRKNVTGCDGNTFARTPSLSRMARRRMRGGRFRYQSG
jgi:hypothetical protein